MITMRGSHNNASRITSGKEWLNLTGELNGTNCFLDIDTCVHGLTLHLNLRFVEDQDWDQIILSTGADNSEGLGIALMFTAMNKSLPFRRYFEAAVLTTTDKYRTWFNLERGVWSLVTISWHRIKGIRVLVDGVLQASNETGASRVPPVTTKQELILGNYLEIGFDRGTVELDELHFLDRATFEDTLEEGRIMSYEVYHKFMCCMNGFKETQFHASKLRLCLVNLKIQKIVIL